MSIHTEDWAKRGRVRVSRDRKGRFVSWHRIRRMPPQRTTAEYPSTLPRPGVFFYPLVKKVAVYGTCVTRQGVDRRRYEFTGSGKDLQRAVILALRVVPRSRFVNAPARLFLMNPSRFGREGYWIDREVDS
jgi:hypothetical protein